MTMANKFGAALMGTRNNLSRTKEYRAWSGMIHRCYHESYNLYHRYGGRGIIVCDRWLNSFDAFLGDMGKCPDGLSLDRINNDGNYEPVNCRWASVETQANNRRHCILYEIDGEQKTLKQWCVVYGKNYGTVWDRINKRGMPALLALTQQEDVRQQTISLKRIKK